MKFSLPLRVPFEEVLIFTQNISTMIKAGVSITEALSALSQNTEHKAMRNILTQISASVEKGRTLAQSLTNFPSVFPPLYTSLVQVGEESGKLTEVFAQLFLQLKKTHDLRAKVKGALIYPTFVVSAMIVIGILMMIFVVPKITAMFTDVNVQLPLPTRILIATSSFMQQHAVLIILGLMALVIGTWAIFKQPGPKKQLHKLFLIMPIIGPISKKVNLAAFARTLSSLIKTDLPIVDCFRLTAPTLGNVIYQEAMLEAQARLQRGDTINHTLADWPNLFPPLVRQMIATGEKSGSVDAILEETADFYERQINEIMTNLPSLLEPILILLLGVGVAALAMAIIMPIYSLTQAF